MVSIPSAAHDARARPVAPPERSPAMSARVRQTPRTRRVLLVVRHPVGGIRTFFRYVYRTDAFAGYAFTLVAPSGPEMDLMRRDLDGLAMEYVPTSRDAGNLAFARGVARCIQARPVDLVHAHGFTAGAAAALPARLRRTPLVVTSHDTFNARQFEGIRGVARKALLTSSLLSADRVHCVSEGARGNLLAHLPGLRRRQQRIVTVRNGIAVAPFLDAPVRNLHRELGFDDDVFLVGFLGRFMSQKGFRYLADAVERLRDTSVGKRMVVLAFASDDGFIREERIAVRQRGLDDAIRFLPFVPDIASTLKGLDVVAMPSLWEACSLLAMEALVAGVPLVATSCVGLGELLHHTPARVVPPADASALAHALADEMQRPTTALARAFAPDAARRFDVRASAAALHRLLDEVVDA